MAIDYKNEERKKALEAIKLIFENLEIAYYDGSNLQARKRLLKASYKAGLAFSRSYVGYVHAVAHSLGGKYNVAHGLANAVILPHMLKMFGSSVYKKLWKLSVHVGLCDENTDYKTGAELFIKKVEDLNEYIKEREFMLQKEEKVTKLIRCNQ